MKTGVKKPLIDSLEYVFTFGKYNGNKLSDVLIDDPKYIEWLLDNEVVEFTEEILEKVHTELTSTLYNERLYPDWFLEIIKGDDH